MLLMVGVGLRCAGQEIDFQGVNEKLHRFREREKRERENDKIVLPKVTEFISINLLFFIYMTPATKTTSPCICHRRVDLFALLSLATGAPRL